MQDKTNSCRAFLGLGVGLASVAAFGSLAARLRSAQAVDNVFPGTATNWRARFWRVGCVLLLAVLLAVLLAARAEAEPRIKVGCTIYDTNRVDPIAFSQHLHYQIGNTSTTNKSTGQSLLNSPSTSCREEWFTSAAWFPVEQGEPVSRVAVYYRAPGDQTVIRGIPKGLQLLAVDQKYSCNEGPFRATPPYGCTEKWGTQIMFPDCWNKSSLEETTTVMSDDGVCPSSHPYRIPRITYLIQHPNNDGVVPNPLLVSAGVDEWHDYTFMHGDYFAANQPVFNKELLDLCLRDAPDSVTVADPRCGKVAPHNAQ
jgi:hypothetical protein